MGKWGLSGFIFTRDVEAFRSFCGGDSKGVNGFCTSLLKPSRSPLDY